MKPKIIMMFEDGPLGDTTMEYEGEHVPIDMAVKGTPGRTAGCYYQDGVLEHTNERMVIRYRFNPNPQDGNDWLRNGSRPASVDGN